MNGSPTSGTYGVSTHTRRTRRLRKASRIATEVVVAGTPGCGFQHLHLMGEDVTLAVEAAGGAGPADRIRVGHARLGRHTAQGVETAHRVNGLHGVVGVAGERRRIDGRLRLVRLGRHAEDHRFRTVLLGEAAELVRG